MAGTNTTETTLADRIMVLLERNRRREHGADELATDLNVSERDVELACKRLVKEGKAYEGSWGSGFRVYGAATEKKAEQEAR